MLKVTTIRTWVTALLLVLWQAGFTLSAAGDVTLVRDGKSDYSIIAPAQPSPAESLAAEEVARYVKAMSGAELARGHGGELPAHAIVICERGHLAGLLQGPMPPEVLKPRVTASPSCRRVSASWLSAGAGAPR